MLISNAHKSGVAGKKTIAGLFLSALMLAMVSGAAFAANVGDEVPFKEGEPMPPAPSGMSWCLVQKPAVYDFVEETVVVRAKANFQVPVPGEYSNRTETVAVGPAYRVGRVIPAQLDSKSMSYVSQEGYEALEIVPPEFSDVMQEVEICPAYDQVSIIPAEFRTNSKRIMSAPAKKSFERTACNGGNLCWTVCETPEQFIDIPVKELVADARETRTSVPAKTQKVMVRKLVKPAQVRRVSIPATNATYQAGVVAAQARVEWQTVPVETREVTVQVETKAPSFASQSLPEKTEKLSRRILSQPEQLVWRLESNGTYVANNSCYTQATPCPVALNIPRGTPHVCSW